MQNFPFFRQSEHAKDCGPTCLKMVCKYYDIDYSISELNMLTKLSDNGTTFYNLQQAAIKLGFDSYGAKIGIDQLFVSVALPCIIHISNSHYVVIVPGSTKQNIIIADPAIGIYQISIDKLKLLWCKDSEEGNTLIIEPKATQKSGSFKISKFKRYLNYFKSYKKQLWGLLFLTLFSGIVSFLLPKISKDLIDKGINNKDINIVSILLIGQFSLLAGGLLLDVLRSWLLFYINNNFTLNVLTDFFSKITKLPISFFESTKTGDIQQRIYDHNRIQSFIISNSSTLLVSTITFIALFSSLLSFSVKILLLNLLFGVLNLFLIKFFLSKRKKLDYAQFTNQSSNQDKIYEILNGIQDLKLHNYEEEKIMQWRTNQLKIIDVSTMSFRLGQKQTIVSNILTSLEMILVGYITANDVIQGSISLGTMVGINLVTGQLKNTILQYTNLLKSYQDAQISIERLEEIQDLENEDENESITEDPLIKSIQSIDIKYLSYKYKNADTNVLTDINLSFEKGDTVAIIGASGCGKTTLLKLLLKYYVPDAGEIIINKHISLTNISSKKWRQHCGIVMQDGYIFTDTIKANIILNNRVFDEVLFRRILELVNLTHWVDSLPSQQDCIIGKNGRVISGGQKQRILIARALYKNPDVLLLDEATSALDTDNEHQIIDKIHNVFSDKIKIIIAHRFSTIKNANKIVVIDKGRIIEIGNHIDLLKKKGLYFDLISTNLNKE